MPKVLVTDAIAQDGIDLLSREAEVDVRLRPSPEELLGLIPSYEALVVRSETKATAEVIAAGEKLQVIGRAGSGVDNIDLDAATERGVIVVNAPEGNTISAAEHTLALMLALARSLPEAEASLRAGLWERQRFIGVELRGKTLGVVGLGQVGSEVARRARGMEMRVVSCDPYVPPERARSLGVELLSLDEPLQQALEQVAVNLDRSVSLSHPYVNLGLEIEELRRRDLFWTDLGQDEIGLFSRGAAAQQGNAEKPRPMQGDAM